jgi:hypothetical protein
MLGYGGYCLTKSHHYSTTIRARRAARRAYIARRRHGPTVALDADGRLLPPAGMVTVAGWEYAGRGYTPPPTPGSPPAWPPTTTRHASSPARSWIALPAHGGRISTTRGATSSGDPADEAMRTLPRL